MAIIDKPTDYFRTKLYTGNNGSQSITFDEDTNMTPDWSWFKTRNRVADSSIMDVVRGVRKSLTSNNDEDEYTESSGLSSWNTNGFSFDGPGFDLVNSNNTFASWHWKAGGGQGSSNTDGSINTTYTSVNTTAGFSISQYTGTGSNATVGHGLGAVPKMIIVKRTNASDVWRVYHGSIGATKHLVLNTTAGEASGSNVWNDTAPTSSVFSISTDSAVNASGATYIAYCFAEKTGYGKFGKYTGNGNANGPFVYTGFKPAFVMVKGYGGTDDWIMMDNKRSGFNSENEYLDANNASAESDGSGNIDFLSNGFKSRSTFSSLNYSGGSYIFMAFAENPFVASNFVTTTAR